MSVIARWSCSSPSNSFQIICCSVMVTCFISFQILWINKLAPYPGVSGLRISQSNQRYTSPSHQGYEWLLVSCIETEGWVLHRRDRSWHKYQSIGAFQGVPITIHSSTRRCVILENDNEVFSCSSDAVWSSRWPCRRTSCRCTGDLAGHCKNRKCLLIICSTIENHHDRDQDWRIRCDGCL